MTTYMLADTIRNIQNRVKKRKKFHQNAVKKGNRKQKIKEKIFMKISTEIDSAAQLIGEEKAVEYIAKAGFNAWDFSMFAMCKCDQYGKIITENSHPLAGPDYLKFARRLKQIGLDNGIVCNQSHAPFPSTLEMQPYLKRAIECTAEAGGKICIIHPDNNKSAQENAKMYQKLLPFAKECGVKIATENMWNWDGAKDQSDFAACATSESFLEHLKMVNDEYFVACLDIGHAEMRGSGSGAANMIRALGPHLAALHVHDNDCHYDSHQIPFSMKIDFNEIAAELRKIHYTGYITLEASSYLESYPRNTEAEKVFMGIKDLSASARKLADMVEGN